ncbi:hypothetical protein NB037_12160 [Rathayibacter sp. ZW T2_19]|uniref:Lipoprotein n=1 Tax=Rathayibacter rubneri TaxID=2950106 RepID=A0A9X2DXU3_9MICO|nr:hypothetical protein [Rathayibacter rubneri]MCM6763172.1 hypothetical protein [Rathayibacter rubneri]
MRDDADHGRSRRPPARNFAATMLLVSVLLSGCSSAPPAAAPTAGDAEFTGPWAAEFRAFSAEAKSDFERGALSDGDVSDQEYAEMTERFRACLEAAGLVFEGFAADGSYTAAPAGGAADAESSRDAATRCSEETGEASLGALHSWISRNPDNEDQAVLMVDCMVRAGLVDSAYTADDWTRENAASSLPASVPADGAEAYEECVADPLGVLGG